MGVVRTREKYVIDSPRPTLSAYYKALKYHVACATKNGRHRNKKKKFTRRWRMQKKRCTHTYTQQNRNVSGQKKVYGNPTIPLTQNKYFHILSAVVWIYEFQKKKQKKHDFSWYSCSTLKLKKNIDIWKHWATHMCVLNRHEFIYLFYNWVMV